MSHDSIDLRRATPDDLPAICALGNDVNAMHHRAWPGVFAPPGEAMRDAAHWRDCIAGEGFATFVAEARGEVLGYLAAQVSTRRHSMFQPLRTGMVVSVGVAEAARGRGVGHALIAHAESWAQAEGAAAMQLNVWAFNLRAISLYEELGYEVLSLSMGKPLGEAGRMLFDRVEQPAATLAESPEVSSPPPIKQEKEDT